MILFYKKLKKYFTNKKRHAIMCLTNKTYLEILEKEDVPLDSIEVSNQYVSGIVNQTPAKRPII